MNTRPTRLLCLRLVWPVMAVLLFTLAASAKEPGDVDGGVTPQAHWDKLSASIPDVSVLDQEGKVRKFYSDLVKGRTVVIDFIFTRCTTLCPLLTATLRQVQQALGEPSVGKCILYR